MIILQSRKLNMIVLALPLMSLAMACNRPSQSSVCQSLLYSADGREIRFPSATVSLRLKEGNVDERRRLINELSEILDTCNGYSKLVAGKALLTFFEEAPSMYFTRAAANALARNCIQIATMPSMETLESLESGGSIWYVVNPRCRMWIDGDTISLRDTPLPEGWKATRVRVFLDGKLVHDDSEETDIPLALFLLEDVLPKEKYLGDHKWSSEITLVTPGDYEITISEDHAFSVCSERDLERVPVIHLE